MVQKTNLHSTNNSGRGIVSPTHHPSHEDEYEDDPIHRITNNHNTGNPQDMEVEQSQQQQQQEDHPLILTVPPPTPTQDAPMVVAPSDKTKNVDPQKQHQDIKTNPKEQESKNWMALLMEVMGGLDSRQGSTVGWKQSHESLGFARKCLTVALDEKPKEMPSDMQAINMSEVRFFVEHYMYKIIIILLDQFCHKVTEDQRMCVVQSLKEATCICALDLRCLARLCSPSSSNISVIEGKGNVLPPHSFLKAGEGGVDSMTISASLRVVYELFNKKRSFYRSGSSTTSTSSNNKSHYWGNTNFNSAHNINTKEIRLSLLWEFLQMSGFRNLANVWHMILNQDSNSSNQKNSALNQDSTSNTHFRRLLLPKVDEMLLILSAVEDLCHDWSDHEKDNEKSSLSSNHKASSPRAAKEHFKRTNPLDDALAVCSVIMHYLGSADEDELKYLHNSSSSLSHSSNNNSHLSNSAYDLSGVRNKLYHICDILALSNPRVHWRTLTQFFTFWREFAYKFISANSLLLRLQGWAEISDLVDLSAMYRPPPRGYRCQGAGVPFVNGDYEYNGKVDSLGYAILAGGSDVQYKCSSVIKHNSALSGETQREELKRITLFRCTMRSNAKWWFLSEADEDQPGTDKDIDYYQHKCFKQQPVTNPSMPLIENEHDYLSSIPPRNGWITCKSSSTRDPAPTLTQINGLMVPDGEEQNSLEHQLGRWIVEKKVIEELVLGCETYSVHREVVARSLPLLQFLAGMCTLDQRLNEYNSSKASPNRDCISDYSLQPLHLKLAWKACLSKTDAAVSNEVFTLLVSLVPYLTKELAFCLFNEVDATLEYDQSSHRPQHGSGGLFEVTEFCSALAASCVNSNSATLNLMPGVRRKLLKILWHLLMVYPYSPTDIIPGNLEQIQKTLRLELSLDTDEMATLREEFVSDCKSSLQGLVQQFNSNIEPTGVFLDEGKALRLVIMTQFVFQVCPTAQRCFFIDQDEKELPKLLFRETCLYLSRIECLSGNDSFSNAEAAMRCRLNVLQYIHTQDVNVFLDVNQLKVLWELCRVRYVFVELILELLQHLSLDQNAYQAFAVNNSNECQKAALEAFKMLFCSKENMPAWFALTKGGYMAFNSLYGAIEDELERKGVDNTASLDTLWRIYMTCRNGDVAKIVMRDILAVYNAQKVSSVKTPIMDKIVVDDEEDDCTQKLKVARMQPASPDDVMMRDSTLVEHKHSSPGHAFLHRILGCLKQSLLSNDRTNDRSEDTPRHLDEWNELAAERCVCLLHAALEWDASSSLKVTMNSDRDLSISVNSNAAFDPKSISMEKIQDSIPHGYMSEASYRSISVIARRNHANNKPHQTDRFIIKLHPVEGTAEFCSKISRYCKHPEEAIRLVPMTSKTSTGGGNQTEIDFYDGMEVTVVLTPTNAIEADIRQSPVNHHGQNQSSSRSGIVSTNSAWVKKNSSSLTNTPLLELSSAFGNSIDESEGDKLFDILLKLLEVLPYSSKKNASNVDDNIRKLSQNQNSDVTSNSTFGLVWDLLLAIPTNKKILRTVHSIAKGSIESNDNKWANIIRVNNHSTVYAMQTIDALLTPAAEPYMLYNSNHRKRYLLLDDEERIKHILSTQADAFREAFISSGGFQAILDYFCLSAKQNEQLESTRTTTMGYGVALRVFKSCLSGNKAISFEENKSIIMNLDKEGTDLLNATFVNPASNITVSTLRFLTQISPTLPDSSLFTSIDLLQILLSNEYICNVFAKDVGTCSRDFTMRLLLWPTLRIRRRMAEVILSVPILSTTLLLWFVDAIRLIDFEHEGVSEFFRVLQSLILDDTKEVSLMPAVQSQDLLDNLSGSICLKLALYPLAVSKTLDSECDSSSLVLCGLLNVLKALLTKGGSSCAVKGVTEFYKQLNIESWSSDTKSSLDENGHLVNFVGYIFDGFLLSPNLINDSGRGKDSPQNFQCHVSSTPICHCKESRKLGFDVILVTMSLSNNNLSKLVLVDKLVKIINVASVTLRNKFGGMAVTDSVDLTSKHRNIGISSIKRKFSGLRNQGCTCYMNSLLQQLFMMKDLREKLCDAPLPLSLRNVSNIVRKGKLNSERGVEKKDMNYNDSLVNKRISIQWESGVNYEAIVQSFDGSTEMHTILYTPLHLDKTNFNSQSRNNSQYLHHRNHSSHNSVDSDKQVPVLTELFDEFCLSEGRPGRETGHFEVLPSLHEGKEKIDVHQDFIDNDKQAPLIEEKDDQKAARKLLEELQRTFVYLSEQQGRCYDPRSLVEVSTCLKLEFDVWQQNDASEYATKLFDRLELPLKKWAPGHFKYFTETFGLKQTKQKICKECGLKTNREETLMNIDLQIRGKTSIHESLSTFCEEDLMCGDNQVNCERCKGKRDTVLRTAISKLPNVLILSLKRFDLDFTTFETVKLNSRCAFEQTLNMKQYTLEGIEEREKVDEAVDNDIDMRSSPEDRNNATKGTKSSDDLYDENYEYKLVGVIIHAGVAQGGHYYSYIKDRSNKSAQQDNDEKWYRFDDEDVTPFDPANIESECFGGKIKKETKWPNGQVTTTETEQFANALMLFYEKVKPTGLEVGKTSIENKDCAKDDFVAMETESSSPYDLKLISGHESFRPDVVRTNTTHAWHTFLFDSEFQSFLNKMLVSSNSVNALSNSSTVRLSSYNVMEDNEKWRVSVLQLSLYFYFDVLLHIVHRDKRTLNEWTHSLVIALHTDKEGAKWFMSELACRMKHVSSNWVRTYYIECPEKNSRISANKVFFNALLSVLGCTSEQEALKMYTIRMKERWNDVKTFDDARSAASSPMSLDEEHQNKCNHQPNADSEGSENSMSSIGIFISYISSLLEISPRRWPFCSEICSILKDLSMIKENQGGSLVKDLMCAIQQPAQAVCLIIRQDAPKTMKNTFPGSCLSFEQSESLSRGICDAPLSSNHLPLLGGIHGQSNTSPNVQGANFHLSIADHTLLLESICGMLNINGFDIAPLVYDDNSQATTQNPRSTRNTSCPSKLTPQAKAALTVIFNEFKKEVGSSSSGLSQSDIQKYMERCGVESVHPQKIASILSKYSTEFGEGGKLNRKLNLEGFLAYYRDASASNDQQVRSDLHTFGFRRNLSRRPENIRVKKDSHNEGNLQYYDNLESIALDVVSTQGYTELNMFTITAFNSFHFYASIYTVCESLTAYVLATIAYNRDISVLLFETLVALNRAPTNWAGTETFNQCLMVFKVALALPDKFQQKRIEFVMNCPNKDSPNGVMGVGLLKAAKDLSERSSSQRFVTEYRYVDAVDRYIELVSELYSKLNMVKKWMDEQQDAWGWMHRWKHHTDIRSTRINDRNVEVTRYSGGSRNSHRLHNQHRINSDSDATGGFAHDSDDDDTNIDLTRTVNDMVHSPRGNDYRNDVKLYRSGRQQNNKAPRYVYVRGAGFESVNGCYLLMSTLDSAPAYVKNGFYKDVQCSFTLYRWPMQENDKSWFISILPRNANPGSSDDIDFYASKGSLDLPPSKGWREIMKHGTAPGPTVSYSSEESVGDCQSGDSVSQDEDDEDLMVTDKVLEDDEDPEIDSNASGVELPSMNRWDQIETRRSLVQSDADDDSCSLPDSHHDVSNNIRNNNIYNP